MDTTLIEFPCNFTIKIIGNHTETFITEIFNLTSQHDETLVIENIQTQLSKNHTYISLSIMVFVADQDQLDAIYQTLTKHPDVKMVL